jgi:hypothetical protein
METLATDAGAGASMELWPLIVVAYVDALCGSRPASKR